jgi:hypothetical protein
VAEYLLKSLEFKPQYKKEKKRRGRRREGEEGEKGEGGKEREGEREEGRKPTPIKPDWSSHHLNTTPKHTPVCTSFLI